MKNLERDMLAKNNVIYYFLWSPESHLGRDDLEKNFNRLYDTFKEIHPDEKLVKEIYYPDSAVAIEVYKIYLHPAVLIHKDKTQ